MRGRGWLLGGIALGVAVGVGEVPFLAGAGRSLAETMERLVNSGGNRIIHAAATHGASQRVVEGFTALFAVLLPGVTALLLVVAARATLRLRAVVGLLLVAAAATGYAYHGRGVASGSLLLALAVAGAAVALSGPLMVAPLGALAGLIATGTLPHLATAPGSSEPTTTVSSLHDALTGAPGAPTWLRALVVVIAAVPFAAGAFLALRR